MTGEVYEHILVEHNGPICRITLNRPDRRNPLSTALMLEVTDALHSAEARVFVLAGAGPAFSAGHDLAEMRGQNEERYREIFAVCTRMMQTIQSIPQPVIARVHGVATAAGCQLVAACDLAVAADDCVFATPGVRIGIFCSTPMVELSRAVGRKRSLQMLLTGTPIDAATAADWGLINAAVPPDHLDKVVTDLALSIAEASPVTVRIGKQTFYRQIECDKDAAYDLAQAVMAANAVEDDAREGVSAFLEHRPPVWTGRL
jgi:enoyl-CoA hydratase/carnithine racemase